MGHQAKLSGLRKLLNSFLFDAHTSRGKSTNAVMLVVIMLAVTATMLGTVDVVKTSGATKSKHLSMGCW